MRLIDADALKNEISKNKKVAGRFIEGVLMLIDNAPTVDIKDEIAGAYNEGYMCGSKEAEKAKPQVTVFCENADEKTIEDLKNELTQDLINKVNVNIGLAQPIKDEKPQGKWIVKSNGTTNYYACNKCGNAGDIQDKFCRECEVKMRNDGTV